MKKLLASVLFAMLGLSAAFAQDSSINVSQLPVADKIIAIVGDNIVLQSDLQSELLKLQQESTTPIPPNAPCAILEQIMAQKALVLQAERDSLPVSDDDVQGRLENQIRGFINMYGSQQKLEEIAGMSIYQIREKFREPIREQLLAKAEQDKINGEVKITPTEVKEYFEKIPKDSLKFYESEVQVGQIVINPKASREVEKYTLSQINDLKKQIDEGKYSFVTLMNLYSQDPGSKRNGGIFTVTRGDKGTDPNFLATAFRLKDGEVSSPVKSTYGYHLIQMVKRQGDNAQVRDLLLIPDITSGDLKNALDKLDSIRSNIIAGKTNFAEAATEFSDDPQAKMTAGMFALQDGSTLLTINQFDPGVVLTIDSLKVGEISRPTVFTDPNTNKQSTRIVYLKSRTKPHRENLEDDYSKIQEEALREKQYEALDKWFNEKMSTFYIMVDKDYQDCKNVEKWATASKTADIGK
jgi:peptidyl-prolyl cis-trans isomerase SurA